MIVARIGADRAAAWDAYVAQAPAGTFFHRYGWCEAVAAALRHPSVPLAVMRGGRIAGILPLVHKRSPIFGDALISVGFATRGGALADDDAARAALEAEALRLGAALAVGHVELRDDPPASAAGPGAVWRRRAGIHDGFRAPLAADDAATLRAIPAKGRRHAVRRSLEAGLEFVAGAHVDAFYPVLVESYRDLGTPLLSRAFMHALVAAFPGACEVFLVRRAGQTLAGCLAIRDSCAIHPFYAGGTRAARAVRAADFLHFNLMRHGRATGASAYDFGRSRIGSGSHAYKRSWGFKPEPMAYRLRHLDGREPPRLDPGAPGFAPLVAAWRRLPLPVARRVGPWIARQIG